MKSESPKKRKNLLRWRENRIRRLDWKIRSRRTWKNGEFVEVKKDEMDRCIARILQLVDAQTKRFQ